MKARTLPVIVLAIAAAVLLSGCAMSKKEYEDRFDSVMQQANKDLYCSNKYEKKADYARAARDLEQIASDLEDLSPPSGIAKSHERWVATIGEMAKHMKSISRNLEKASTDRASEKALVRDANALQEDSRKLDALKKQYEKRGYKLKNHKC